MPLPYRVPFQSSCGVFWTLYLSLVNSRYVCPAEACVAPVSHDATERTRKRIAAMPFWKPASDQHKAQRELKASLHLPSTYPYFVHGQFHRLHEQHRPTYDSLPPSFTINPLTHTRHPPSIVATSNVSHTQRKRIYTLLLDSFASLITFGQVVHRASSRLSANTSQRRPVIFPCAIMSHRISA